MTAFHNVVMAHGPGAMLSYDNVKEDVGVLKGKVVSFSEVAISMWVDGDHASLENPS